jgi:hypothetical protein
MKYLKKYETKLIDDVTQLGGWVNVKIDEKLFIRMARYVLALDTLCKRPSDRFNLFKKIEMLSNVDTYMNDTNVDIQTKISIITLLQYLNELKNQFNPSSSGFLLEGFLAALIHGIKVSGYKPADVSTAYSELDAVRFEADTTRGIKKIDYQIKLYKKGGNIKINWKEICDYYVICLKDGDKIEVHILTPGDPEDTEKKVDDMSWIGRYAQNKTEGGFIRYNKTDKDGNQSLPYVLLNTNKLRHHSFMRVLDVGDAKIESLIEKCGRSVKRSISSVYGHLSELHYNVDSLVSGYNKNKVKITAAVAKKETDETIKQITREVSNLERNIRR